MPELMTEEAFALKLNDLEDASFVYEQSQGTVSCERMREKLRAARAVVLAAYSAALAAQPDPRVTALVEALDLVLCELVTGLSDDGFDPDQFQCVQKARAALAAAKGESADECGWRDFEHNGHPHNGELYEVRGHGVLKYIAHNYEMWHSNRAAWLNAETRESVEFVGSQWRPITEPAAERPWTRSEDRMPSIAWSTLYIVRGNGINGTALLRVMGRHGVKVWSDVYGNGFDPAGTEWRPAPVS